MKKKTIFCAHDNPEKIIKYGFQNGEQKYKCKNCGKYFFKNKREGYTLKEKKFFSMLINFIRDSSEQGIDLQEAISNINSNIDIKEISKFRLYQRTSMPKYKRMQSNYSDTISCYNPRLLICEDNKNIIMYRFPERAQEDGNSRRILIIDSDDNKDVRYITLSEYSS